MLFVKTKVTLLSVFSVLFVDNVISLSPMRIYSAISTYNILFGRWHSAVVKTSGCGQGQRADLHG